MTEYKKIFIDTAPFIYFLENNPHYFEKAKDFFMQSYTNGINLITSTITLEEYFVYPYIYDMKEYIDNFENFLIAMRIDVVSIDPLIAKQAARIRAQYKDFKSMDALQLAAARVNNCDCFLTNDKQLRQYKELNCVTLDDIDL